jgi:hypothetical protein
VWIEQRDALPLEHESRIQFLPRQRAMDRDERQHVLESRASYPKVAFVRNAQDLIVPEVTGNR